ncbi:formyltransferase family protein [Vibrio tubiashii]|uniref:formyltransferase family protein n=1 Tax=Vibrio tubiashii TaxID=29498 RepID=UPI00349EC414
MKNKRIKVLFMGRKNVAAKCLHYLLKCQGIDIVGVITDSQLENSTTAKLAAQYNLPIFSFEQALAKLKNKELMFDLGISMLFWRKLKDEFLTVPSLGIINFHPAPLPEYKGTAGYNLAILDGLDSWGMTAHYVDESIDTGDIIKVLRFNICSVSETVQSLESISQDYLFDLFIDVINKVEKSMPNKVESTPNIGGRYISRSEMESMKEIKPGDDVSRKIRAFWFPPYDGAYIIIDEKKYSLVDRNILESLSSDNISNVFGNNNA